jgi:hypothetical protein
MQRIVDGILYEGKRLSDSWDVSIWEKNGHREISAREVIEWSELGPVPPLKELDELLTATYRENQTSREVCKGHFKELVRRAKRALGGEFRYCASFERQDRGAMHIHIACHKLPKHGHYKGVKIPAWRLLTVIWRDIVGADNGLVFVGGKKKWSKGRRKNLSAAKMASYVSKYIMKDYSESPAGSNRYSRSNAIEVPKPVHVRLVGVDLADAIGAMFQCDDGDVVVSHRLGHFKDSYWLCTEPRPPLH